MDKAIEAALIAWWSVPLDRSYGYDERMRAAIAAYEAALKDAPKYSDRLEDIPSEDHFTRQRREQIQSGEGT